MEVFLARQPILDRFNKLYAYELLFRNSEKNIYQAEDGDKATIELIKNTFISIGIEKVTGNKKAFINFTENILKSDIFEVLPSKSVIIEILEDIEPTQEIVELCRKLKKQGYVIALDDFIFSEKYRELLEIVDIIKVDFKITIGDERRTVIERINNPRIKFLAEKVETMEEFNEAISYGYEYFQGYYLSKPTMISGKKIAENKAIYIKILQEINSKHFTIESMESLVKKDVSLSFKLLKLLNSSYYNFVSEIKSIKQAMALLGEKEIKKWLYLIVFKTIGEDKPEILIINSLTRAKFAEIISKKIKVGIDPFNAYLTGILSMIDLLLNRPIDQILEEISIPKKVEDGLNGVNNNVYKKLLDLIIAYEKGEWGQVSKISKELNLDENALPQAYYEAIFYAKL